MSSRHVYNYWYRLYNYYYRTIIITVQLSLLVITLLCCVSVTHSHTKFHRFWSAEALLLPSQCSNATSTSR